MSKNAPDYLKVLADDTRWRILCLVKENALCLCELTDILKMPQSSLSSHVQIIRKAGLVESERRGKWTYFRLKKGQLSLFHHLLEHFPENRIQKNDQKRAQARLINRASSCCPGPIKLV